MKKWIGLAAAAVLTASMAMGASAASVEAKLVLGFEKFEVGAKAVDSEWATIDHKQINDKWSATVVEEGQDGQGLEVSQMRHAGDDGKNVEPNMTIDLTKDVNITDWTGGTDLYFWIDSTGWDSPRIMIRLISGENTFVTRHLRAAEGDKVAGTTEKSIAYVQDAKGNFVEVPDAWYGRLQLPANYKGWVKMPLNMETFMPQWWGTDEQKNATLDLSNITGIAINLQTNNNDADGEKTAVFDSFAVAGLADADVTIDGAGNAGTNNGGNTGGNTNKPTTPGSNTGEAAIPALLLVALPVSAGVLFACKKRSK